jgi:hypothetical protein
MTLARPLPFIPTSPVIHVGPRRPEHRRLATLGFVSLGAVMAVLGSQALPSDPNPATFTPHRGSEPQQAPALPASFSTASSATPFTDLLAAEDAWAMGNWPAAAHAWLHHGQHAGPQDLSVAGWAVRAAVRSHDSALLHQTLDRWNTVRAALPESVRGQVTALTPTTPADRVYAAMVEAGAGRADTQEAWLQRAPTAAEMLSDAEQCAWAPGCQDAPALPWSQLNQMAAQQVKAWRNRGFTPQEAWDWYRERLLLGDAEHEVSSTHHQQLTPLEQFRLAMQKRLARVATAPDLKAYFASWKDEQARYGVVLDSPGEQASVGGLWAQQVNWAARLAGQGSGWPPLTSASATDQWTRVQAWVARDLSALPVGPMPDTLTMAEADKRLQAAVQQSGLRQLRWPAVFPITPAVKGRLAALLTQSNQALQRATGWDGPVLGQAGHVVLALTTPVPGEEQGAQTPLQSVSGAWDTALIGTVIDRHSLGSLAHEWWHAHDFFVGTTQNHPAWASQLAADLDQGGQWDPGPLSPTARPLGALWHQVTQAPLTPAQVQMDVLEGWVGRWSYQQPYERAHWLAEAADVRGHRHTLEDSQGRWGSALPALALQELRDALAPARPLGESLALQAPVSPAGWLRLSRQTTTPGTDYWGAPPELLARAFERQLADQRLFASDSQRVWLYYPQGMEKAWQSGAWHAYFQAQETWWQTWKAAGAPEAPARTLGQAVRVPQVRR